LHFELVLCQPLFPGESGVDQLVEIIKVTKKTLIPCMEKTEKDFFLKWPSWVLKDVITYITHDLLREGDLY
jgi:hypothetical protein